MIPILLLAFVVAVKVFKKTTPNGKYGVVDSNFYVAKPRISGLGIEKKKQGTQVVSLVTSHPSGTSHWSGWLVPFGASR